MRNNNLFAAEGYIKQIGQHDAKIDLSDCPHCCSVGDNYGESCRHCGKQLKGYGNGGWFGGNLNGTEKCIHDFVAWACVPEMETCRFCEKEQQI